MENFNFKKILFFMIVVFNVYVWTIIFNYYFLKPSVNFLDVNQGDAILFVTKSGNVLVDAGKKNYIKNPLSKVMPFKDSVIDVVFITHADLDHYEGLFYVLENYKVRVVILNDFYTKTEKYQALLDKIIQKNIKIVLGVAGVSLKGDSLMVDILYPKLTEINIKKTNENSIVLLANLVNKKVLLTGDITAKILSKIADNSLNVKKIDIFKVPHHGAKDTIEPSFLEKFDIKEAIISVGDNSYGHPHVNILDLFKEFSIDVFRTDIVGTIKF